MSSLQILPTLEGEVTFTILGVKVTMVADAVDSPWENRLGSIPVIVDDERLIVRAYGVMEPILPPELRIAFEQQMRQAAEQPETVMAIFNKSPVAVIRSKRFNPSNGIQARGWKIGR